MLVIGYFYVLSATPIPAASQFAVGQASRVYFRDGTTLVGMFGESDRQTLQPNQIPTMVRNAMVAAEDKHFYDEGGVSPVGIARAAIADLTSGSVQQGGSTITQQLVRNYYTGIGTAETASRKIKEIFVAEKLAQEESKNWILTNYMNTVPTGANNMYGFGAAAEAYFGVPVKKLTVAQAAMIAAMPQSPSYYNPNPKAGAAYQALVFRWHYVLRTMVSDGHADPGPGQRAEVPQAGQGVQQQLVGLPRLHHDRRAQRAGEHLPLHAGPDRRRRAEDHHHVQQADDEPAVRDGGAGKAPDAARWQGAAQLRARRCGAGAARHR